MLLRLLPRRFDDVRTLLRHDNSGRHRVRSNDLREHRRVTNPQPANAMNAELRVYHARPLPAHALPHPARRRVVETRAHMRPDERVHRLVVRCEPPGRKLQVAQYRIALLANLVKHAHRNPDAFSKWLVVRGVREEAEVDVGMRAWVRGREADGAFGLGADEGHRQCEYADVVRVDVGAVVRDHHHLDVRTICGDGRVEVAGVCGRHSVGGVHEARGVERGTVLERTCERAPAYGEVLEELCDGLQRADFQFMERLVKRRLDCDRDAYMIGLSVWAVSKRENSIEWYRRTM